MAKTLTILKGTVEIPKTDGSFTCDYVPYTVTFTSFCGGMERGHSLQITIEDFTHVQLDNNSVKKLIEILTETYLK